MGTTTTLASAPCHPNSSIYLGNHSYYVELVHGDLGNHSYYVGLVHGEDGYAALPDTLGLGRSTFSIGWKR